MVLLPWKGSKAGMRPAVLLCSLSLYRVASLPTRWPLACSGAPRRGHGALKVLGFHFLGNGKIRKLSACGNTETGNIKECRLE